ncbi:MAG: YdcF family protein [Vicinamibacterales bacterium]
MIYLSKTLPLFVLPIGVTIILALVGVLTRRRWLVFVSLANLWIFSLPPVAGFLTRNLEGGMERLPAESMPVADAIVVLSTGRVAAPGRAAVSEWGDPDRFFGGVDLMQTGKAPLLVFTGGSSPFSTDSPLEGEVLAMHATRLGVPADRILTTTRVVNTAEEAVAVAALLRSRQPEPAHVLLVTSAFHMLRASRQFERSGMRVTPFPVDFSGTGLGGQTFVDLLPTARALSRSEVAIRELYGRLYYRLNPS